MMVTMLIRSIWAAVLCLGLLVAPIAKAQDRQPVAVKDFDVFVDLPTAFAFIKLPTGWKFIGKLDPQQLRNLPAGTLTSLLPALEPSAVTEAPTEVARKSDGRAP